MCGRPRLMTPPSLHLRPPIRLRVRMSRRPRELFLLGGLGLNHRLAERVSNSPKSPSSRLSCRRTPKPPAPNRPAIDASIHTLEDMKRKTTRTLRPTNSVAPVANTHPVSLTPNLPRDEIAPGTIVVVVLTNRALPLGTSRLPIPVGETPQTRVSNA